MLLMCSDKVIAYQTTQDGKQVMKKVDGIDDYVFPYKLFPENSNTISVFKFGEWAKYRCFPEERLDAAELLAELGLDHYDRWEIVKKTNARLHGRDEFWVDFSK